MTQDQAAALEKYVMACVKRFAERIEQWNCDTKDRLVTEISSAIKDGIRDLKIEVANEKGEQTRKISKCFKITQKGLF